MMRERKWYPIFYMFVVTAAFSSIVIGFSALTQERVEANTQLAFEAAVLEAGLGHHDPARSGPEVHRKFVEQVSDPNASSGGAYILRQDGRFIGYALPFEGQGFWARVKGIIGVEPDKRTVTGIAFYEQSETPGLGAEIVRPKFREQFKGRVLGPKEKPIRMRRPGSSLGESDVYAVTGATQTTVRVEEMMNRAIRDWQTQVEAAGTSEGGPKPTGGAS
ncbi:MAG: FMN-binding protein [Planctomycetes bacterium]|jgi:Na+-transporting NADH:ubiquinone oxidoreductase subunit NqrC|nr:FMN-binding protein [Planctomycetota bacterium]